MPDKFDEAAKKFLARPMLSTKFVEGLAAALRGAAADAKADTMKGVAASLELGVFDHDPKKWRDGAAALRASKESV